jgi:hypothetical protein
VRVQIVHASEVTIDDPPPQIAELPPNSLARMSWVWQRIAAQLTPEVAAAVVSWVELPEGTPPPASVPP